MRRKNPVSVATLSRLTVTDVAHLGTHDEARTDARGLVELDGPVDTTVLKVKENAEFDERVNVGRLLEVGEREHGSGDAQGGYAGDAGYGGYGGYGGDGGSGGFPSDPSKKGLTIDEVGVLRTDGYVVVNDREKGLVLRAPDGTYRGFTVRPDGSLDTAGKPLGVAEP